MSNRNDRNANRNRRSAGKERKSMRNRRNNRRPRPRRPRPDSPVNRILNVCDAMIRANRGQYGCGFYLNILAPDQDALPYVTVLLQPNAKTKPKAAMQMWIDAGEVNLEVTDVKCVASYSDVRVRVNTDQGSENYMDDLDRTAFSAVGFLRMTHGLAHVR